MIIDKNVLDLLKELGAKDFEVKTSALTLDELIAHFSTTKLVPCDACGTDHAPLKSRELNSSLQYLDFTASNKLPLRIDCLEGETRLVIRPVNDEWLKEIKYAEDIAKKYGLRCWREMTGCPCWQAKPFHCKE